MVYPTKNTAKSRDLRTKAIVLRRTKYGETDRILNLLTPEGQISVLAKGVRKEKSRLAGGIEMFCISDVVIHQGRSSLGTLTSARMSIFYQNLLTDFTRLELASSILKQVGKISDQFNSPELFSLVEQVFEALHNDTDTRLVETWALFNLAKICGEEPNLHFDTSGQKLTQEQVYSWNTVERALSPTPRGSITSDHVKLMRLMTVTNLSVVAKVKNCHLLLDDILSISRII